MPGSPAIPPEQPLANGAARSAPAALRNRDPILAVLQRVLPGEARVLEIASGTGEHAVHFASAAPGWIWQPTDPDTRARASITAHAASAARPNLLPPLALDAADWPWPVTQADAIVCINMIHISPWASTVGLMRGAEALLPAGAPLVLYGPFKENGRHTAAGNEAFDDDLRRRDPRWGVRDLQEVTALAREHGLTWAETVAMPANNRTVVFRRD